MTPVVEVSGVHAKMECVHPTGSIKDRMAAYILERSEAEGLLRPGMRIVEASSGNTGIAFAYYGARKGYPVTIVMPEHMTEERRELIEALGAELILCSRDGGFAEAACIRDEIAERDETVFNPDQFANELNVECHRTTTGPELISQVGATVDAFVAGVGTGGTLVGVGKALKGANPSARVVAVEPEEAAVMTGGRNEPHGIFGIGDGFIPDLASGADGPLHPIIDGVEVVSTEEATEAARFLAARHGLCVGVSSGANFVAALRLKADRETVATVFPDGSRKYASCGLSSEPLATCPIRSQCEGNILNELLDSLRRASHK